MTEGEAAATFGRDRKGRWMWLRQRKRRRPNRHLAGTGRIVPVPVAVCRHRTRRSHRPGRSEVSEVTVRTSSSPEQSYSTWWTAVGARTPSAALGCRRQRTGWTGAACPSGTDGAAELADAATPG